jgi:ribosomal protein S18 acetylase RimI-like enzyme
VREEDRAALEGIAAAFELGLPGSAVRCWIAWRGAEPVAKAFLHLAAGAAGLYAVATRPEARGLGLARNLTLHGFAAARAAGYRLGILHSTPMARTLYEKLGFLSATRFRMFTPAGSFHL